MARKHPRVNMRGEEQNVKKIILMIGMGLVAAMPAAADVVWNEDFSDVSDWALISNPSNDASVVSSGGLGLFTELSPGMLAPNGAAFGSTTRIAFDSSSAGDYTFSFTVDSIGGSMSYDIAFDCFSNATDGYVDTVWNVYPNGAFTGTTNINLGTFSFASDVTYISPKLTIHTGEGNQTVAFDAMSMDQQVIPEPASLALILGGGLAVVLLRKRTR